MDKLQTLFKTLFVAAFAIGASTLVTACSDETKDSITKTDPSTEDAAPTTDQLGVCYEGKTLLVGDDRSDIDAAIAARIKNPATEFAPNLASVVLVKGANVKVKVADVPQLVEAYNNYTNFVIVGGKGNQTVASLVDTVNHAIAQLDAEGKDTKSYRRFLESIESARLQLDKDSTHASSVAAFRKNSSYGSLSLASVYDNTQFENTDSVQFQINEDNFKPNAYRYGLSADNLVTWMKESDELDNGGNDDEEYGIYTISKSTSYGPTGFVCEAVCGLNYKIEIIPLHKFDTDEDYYLIRYLMTIKNSDLPDPYTLHKGYLWYTTDDGDRITPSYYTWSGSLKFGWLGPILVMLNFDVDMYQSEGGNEEIIVSDPQPRPSAGKEYGFDFAMDNVCPIEPMVTSNASPSYSYKKKWKVEPIENLNVTPYIKTSPDSSVVDWMFVGTFPTYSSSCLSRVPDYQTNDFTTGFSWITKIKNPKQGVRYRFRPTPHIYHDEICRDDPQEHHIRPDGPNDWLDYTKAPDGRGTKGYEMPEPVRSRTTYKIVVNCVESKHNTWFNKADEQIESELGFCSQKPVYSYAKTDAEGVKQAVKAFNQYVEKLTVKSRQSALWFRANFSLIRTDNGSNETLSEMYVDNMD